MIHTSINALIGLQLRLLGFIPNAKLLSVLGKNISLLDAFKAANSILQGAVQGIAELITLPGLINVDLPILGVREDIYKIETMDRKEANAIINRNSARIKTENKIRFFDFAINAFTYCIIVPLILLMALENGSGG